MGSFSVRLSLQEPRLSEEVGPMDSTQRLRAQISAQRQIHGDEDQRLVPLSASARYLKARTKPTIHKNTWEINTFPNPIIEANTSFVK